MLDHARKLAAAILDRVLERGRFIHLDGPSGRTRHLNLEETLPENTKRLRISGIGGSDFPEPTAFCKLLILKDWSGRKDLNLRPPGPELSAKNSHVVDSVSLAGQTTSSHLRILHPMLHPEASASKTRFGLRALGRMPVGAESDWCAQFLWLNWGQLSLNVKSGT